MTGHNNMLFASLIIALFIFAAAAITIGGGEMITGLFVATPPDMTITNTNTSQTIMPLDTMQTAAIVENPLSKELREHLGQRVQIMLNDVGTTYVATMDFVLEIIVSCGSTLNSPADKSNSGYYCLNYTAKNIGNIPDTFAIDVANTSVSQVIWISKNYGCDESVSARISNITLDSEQEGNFSVYVRAVCIGQNISFTTTLTSGNCFSKTSDVVRVICPPSPV